MAMIACPRLKSVPRTGRGLEPAQAAPLSQSAVADAPSGEAPTAVGALVVGGGPSGYATAMALSQQGFQDILILERAQSSSFFDPTMGFVYNISAPGRAALSEVGVTNIQELVDPMKLDLFLTGPPTTTQMQGLTTPGMVVKYLEPDGKVRNSSVMMGRRDEDLSHQGTWMHRHTFNDALYKHSQEHHSDHIKVEFSTKVDSVKLPERDGEPLTVTAVSQRAGDTGQTTTFTCRLLVAADGANSIVRRALDAAQPDAGWGMELFPSDASGLAYKVLPLPPNPTLSTAGGELPNTQVAVVPGTSVDGAHPLRLGLLAVKDTKAARTANFILWPSHPFWKVSTTDELYKYLEAAFPQLDRLRENIPEEVAQKFVSSRLGTFKDPQACKRLFAEFPGAKEAEVEEGDAAAGLKGASVLLLGDAAHVFPPDIGQGVNAALLDVSTLRRCMADNPKDLSAALREYEATRVPENQALVRIMQFAFPYQYKQAGMKVKSMLWGANAVTRLLLSKVLPQLFSGPVAFTFPTGSQQHKGSMDTLYRETLAAGNRTTRNLMVLLGVLVAGAAVMIGRLV